MHEDVGRHERGVGQEARIDVVGLLACLVLEGSGTLQLPEVGVHIEVEVELQHLTHIALHVDGRLLGVDPTGQILGQDRIGRAYDVVGMGVGRQRVPVCDEEEAIVLLLHLDEGAYSTEVIT